MVYTVDTDYNSNIINAYLVSVDKVVLRQPVSEALN